MQKPTDNHTNDGTLHHAAEIGARALETIQTGATRAVTSTGNAVRNYPLSAVGIAFGGGLALGALAYRLIAPRRD